MKKTMFLQAINETLFEEMRRDERVFVMGEDVELSPMGGTAGLVDEFGKERVRNTPLSELAIIGAAAGAAAMGMRPVVDMMMASFFYCGIDQLINNVAKLRYMSGGQMRLPVVFRATTGCLGSAAAQHSSSPHAIMMHTPGIKVIMPSNAYDVKGLLRAAIRDDDPVIFFEHGQLGATMSEIPDEDYTLPIGKAEVKREGTDVTIVANALMLVKSLAAAETLQNDGISAEVVDLRTLVPLDKETILKSLEKTGRMVVVDEGHMTCGLTGEIAGIAAEEGFDFLKAPVKRIAMPDVPIGFSPVLENHVVPDEENIIQAVKDII
ncbi:MAG: alpha-ketoacid dehydrogenase subunit beta [Nitrospina sp.]|jgi:acetoin:2,6-dichlorophenolindophenol oxidoreductase subunit beta|nr:alpha-ketoacid dehydrogenase subunit beta [Nitrospina sp.]